MVRMDARGAALLIGPILGEIGRLEGSVGGTLASLPMRLQRTRGSL